MTYRESAIVYGPRPFVPDVAPIILPRGLWGRVVSAHEAQLDRKRGRRWEQGVGWVEVGSTPPGGER